MRGLSVWWREGGQGGRGGKWQAVMVWKVWGGVLNGAGGWRGKLDYEASLGGKAWGLGLK